MGPGILSSQFEALRRDRRGNVALMFGLALIPIIGFVGAAVDYSRAADFKTKLNRAADAAALVAAKDRNSAWARRKAAAEQVFNANLGPHEGLDNVWFKATEIESGVRIEAGGDVQNQIMGVVGFRTSAVGTSAEAITITNPTEIALVLDNTGSMRNDMPALRKAAQNFTETVFNNAAAEQVRVGVVPYVAAVNPGRANLQMSWMDTGANSKWHGLHLRGKTIASMTGCNPDPDPKPAVVGGGSGGGGGGSSGPPPETDSPPTGKDRAASLPIMKTMAEIAIELFGVPSARAQVTPATDNPNSGTDANPGKTAQGNAYRPGGGSAKVPTGFQYYHPCWLGNPPKVSHFDLFNRIDGARWKGCVEARPEPYDVTDEPATAFNPDTLFVPYFWPDEPGRDNGSANKNGRAFNNSYLEDGSVPPGWTYYSDDPTNNYVNEWYAYANLFKYTLSNKAKIKENGPDTSGPNAACPDEILPLSTKKADVLNAIQKLSHWNGGGTISSEGLMWGWRVLSPGPPFTEGSEYGKAQKYIVLMTDGLNSFVENNADGPTKSDYTAYGYLRDGRLPSDWFRKGQTYLNDRMRLACQNSKRTGITVITILFRETDSVTQQLLKDCASEGNFSYIAANENDLRRAFEDVAGKISRLRLTK